MKNSKYGYSALEYKKFQSHAWRYLLLFSLLYCSHYCTRLNISNIPEFDTADLGIITSTLFGVTE